MNRNLAKKIGEAINRVIKENSESESILNGYDIGLGGGSFDENTMTMRLSFSPKVSMVSMKKAASQTTDSQVKSGLASAGTPVFCQTPNGEQRGTIVRPRITNYLIKGIGGEMDGKEFTYPMRATQLAQLHLV